MFESVELGRKIAKEDYNRTIPELRTKLLEIQWKLKNAKIPVFIIISGTEDAGKGETINKLHEWMDSRGITTHAVPNSLMLAPNLRLCHQYVPVQPKF